MSDYAAQTVRYARNNFRVVGNPEGGRLKLHCPIQPDRHENGDASPSAVLFLESGMVYCSRCGKRYLDQFEEHGFPAAPPKPGNRKPDSRRSKSRFAEKAREVVRRNEIKPSLPDPARIQRAQERLICREAQDYLKSRGLRPETAERFGFGWIRSKEGRNCLLIPSLRDGVCVNYKLRRTDRLRAGESKYFAQHKGGAKVLWNLDSVPQGAHTVVIAEGELDAATISQAVGEELPTVSATQGAATFPGDWIDALEDRGVREIIWAFDDDEPGREAMAKHMRRFDPSIRHRRCIFPDSKDANVWLVRRLQKGEEASAVDRELSAIVRSSPHTGPGGCIQMMGWMESLRSDDPEDGICDCHTPWPSLNRHLRKWLAGDTVGLIAYPKIGKSTLAMQMVRHRWEHFGETALIYYTEDGSKQAGRRLMCQHLGITDGQFAESKADWLETPRANELLHSDRIWLCDARLDKQEDYPEMLRELIRYTGADVVLFDHFHKILQVREDYYLHQAKLAERFVEVAEETGVRLILVLQPNKEDKGTWRCNSSRISGSAGIKACIQHFICLSREPLSGRGGEVLSHCAQLAVERSRRNEGGEVWVEYDPGTLTFLAAISQGMKKKVGTCVL